MEAFSASQIQAYLDCPRKWAWRSIDKVETQQHPSAAKGTAVHKQLEQYFRDVVPLDYTTDVGYIAESGLRYLPMPAAHLEVEKEFLLIGRHRYYGLVDLRDPPAKTVYDHKTTSSLKWAKTEDDLRTDVQATIYAAQAIVEWQVPEVWLQWTYMQTKGARKSSPVIVRVNEDEVAGTFAAIEQVADEMAAIKASGKKALDLLPEPSSCEKYGGCPYRSLCNLGPKERMRSVMSQGARDLLNMLKNRETTQVAPGQVNPPEAALATTVPARDVGDPPSVQDAPRTDVPAATGHPEAPADPPKPEERPTVRIKEDKPAKVKKPVKVLYVNCTPLDGKAQRAETFIELAKRAVSEKDLPTADGKTIRVTDYRFVPFGQGAGVLLNFFQQLVEKEQPNELTINTHSCEAQIVISWLSTQADRVVIG